MVADLDAIDQAAVAVVAPLRPQSPRCGVFGADGVFEQRKARDGLSVSIALGAILDVSEIGVFQLQAEADVDAVVAVPALADVLLQRDVMIAFSDDDQAVVSGCSREEITALNDFILDAVTATDGHFVAVGVVADVVVVPASLSKMSWTMMFSGLRTSTIEFRYLPTLPRMSQPNVAMVLVGVELADMDVGTGHAP